MNCECMRMNGEPEGRTVIRDSAYRDTSRQLPVNYQIQNARRTTHHNPRVLPQAAKHEIQHLPTHVIEIHVDQAYFLLPLLLECVALVVERDVDADGVAEPCAFLFGACDGDDVRADVFAECAHDGTDCTRSSGDDERLTRFGLSDLVEALPRARERCGDS